MKKQKIKKVIKCKAYSKEDFERDERRRVRRILRLGVDLQKIEDAPITKQEREIQKEMAVVPEAANLLIREEEEKLLRTMLKTDLLSPSEKLCVQLILEGERPIDVARKLGVRDTTVHEHLSRAVSKLRQAFKEGDPASTRKN